MIFQLNSRQSGRHIAAEAKDKKAGNVGGKEGAANVKTVPYYLIILPVVLNHGLIRK